MTTKQNPHSPDRDPHEPLRTCAWEANVALQLFVREIEKCAPDPEEALELAIDLIDFFADAKDFMASVESNIERLVRSGREVVLSPSLAST